MHIYETHMHTSTVSACAISTPAEQVRAYKRRGYTGIIVTDHFINGNAHSTGRMPWAAQMKFFVSGYEKAKAEAEKQGLDVFLGWEYSIKGADFLTYGLDLEFLLAHPKVATLTIQEYSKLVRKNNGYIAQAHPFRKGFWIETPHPVAPELLDGIEVYNSGMHPEINRKAYNFAKKHNIPMQAGSDSHEADCCNPSGIILKKRAESIHDIINALKSNQVEMFLPKGFFS